MPLTERLSLRFFPLPMVTVRCLRRWTIARWKWSRNFSSTKSTVLLLNYSSFASPASLKVTKPAKGRRRELSREEADEIREAFELFDNDKDNELDYHEFKVTIFIARYNPSILLLSHPGRSSSARFRCAQGWCPAIDAWLRSSRQE